MEKSEQRSQIDATMDFDQNEHVCIRVEFRHQIQYCDIRLDDLSRETFLEDGTKSTQIRLVFSIKL